MRGRAITYRLHSITSNNTAREKVMENATLRAVRAMRTVFCGVLFYSRLLNQRQGFP